VSNRGDKFDQSILYVCIQISQWNPFVWLIYANKSIISTIAISAIKTKNKTTNKPNVANYLYLNFMALNFNVNKNFINISINNL
jgi:hypothetical protein